MLDFLSNFWGSVQGQYLFFSYYNSLVKPKTGKNTSIYICAIATYLFSLFHMRVLPKSLSCPRVSDLQAFYRRMM